MKKHVSLFSTVFLFFISAAFVTGQPCFNGGTGVDGAYSATANTSLTGGTYNYTSFHINAGVVVNVVGTQPLVINCTGNVTIDGSLTANGGNGGNGVTYTSGGAGGVGVAGGGNGGSGSFSTPSGPINGTAGNGSGGANTQGLGWSGGGGAGYANVGSSSGGVGGFGGPVYGDVNISGFEAGSGGGGGSGGYDCGAGGGGAGGGIIRINAGGSINIGVTGFISANGGNGGSDGTGNCGGGGGGSGGSIILTSATVVNNGTLQCVGGTGGASNVANAPYWGAGGLGAVGRIRVDHNAVITGSGIFTPAIGAQFPVNSPPVFVTVASPNDSICAGAPLTLYGNGDATSYAWTGGITDSVAFTPASSLTYTVTATGSLGCTSTSSISITVLPLPTISYTTSPNDSVCEGGLLTLNGTGGSNYTWTGGINNNVAFTPAGSGTYTVTGTDAFGCSNTANANIVVHPLPNISYTASPNNSICNGSLLTLNGTGGSNYTWSGGINNNVAFTPAGSGTYTVTGTDAFGCTNTATANIVLNPPPVVNLGPDIVQPNPPVVLDAGAGFSTYIWNTTATTATISVTTNGTYFVTVTDANGCTNSDTVQVNFTAGINDPMSQLPGIFVYPNPSNGMMQLLVKNTNSTQLQLMVVDLTGKLVKSTSISLEPNANTTMLDLSELNSGVYILQVTSENIMMQQRLIIQK